MIHTVNIDTLSAGREMDALVAEKVMGWSPLNRTEHHLSWNVPEGIRTWEETSYGSFKPSTSIAAAWEVVEKLRKEEIPIEITSGFFGPYSCRIASNHGWLAMVQADTAPLAICRAALKACEVNERPDRG